jgi:hypothetical protein
LFELRCKYSWALQRKTKEYFTEGKNIWTIDRERDVWLESGVAISDPDTDYRMPTAYSIWTLYAQGRYYEVILQGVFSEPGVVSEGVRAVTWKLASIRPTPEEEFSNDDEQLKFVEEALKTESAKHFSDQSVIEVLKEALEVYGMNGQTGPYGIGDTHIKVDNIIVTLKV